MISDSEKESDGEGREAVSTVQPVRHPRPARPPAILYFLAALVLISLPVMGILLLLEVQSLAGLLISVTAAIIPAVFYVWLVMWIDKREKEPLFLRIGAFLWGAGVAVLLAAVLNTFFGLAALAVAGPAIASFWSTVIEAPIVEETLKWSALLVLFFVLRDEFDSVLDGILYGALVGLGFAMSENVLYFGRAYLEGGPILLTQTFLLRAVYAGLGHALYAGIAGAGLGYAREIGRRPTGAFVAIVAYFGAILQHSAWNLFAGTIIPSVLPAEVDETAYLFFVAPLISLLLMGPGLLLLLVIGYAGLRRESQLIRTELRDEVAAGVVTPEEYRLLPSTWQRLYRRLRALFTGGFRSWHLLGELYQAETELAYRKLHAEKGDNAPCYRRYCEPEEYRRAIAEIHEQLPTAEQPEPPGERMPPPEL